MAVSCWSWLGPHLAETIATIHRLVTTGYKGDRSVNPALRAHDWMHLSGSGTSPLTLSSLTILGTPPGFVGESSRSEEFLLASREGKIGPAIHAGKGFV